MSYLGFIDVEKPGRISPELLTAVRADLNPAKKLHVLAKIVPSGVLETVLTRSDIAPSKRVKDLMDGIHEAVAGYLPSVYSRYSLELDGNIVPPHKGQRDPSWHLDFSPGITLVVSDEYPTEHVKGSPVFPAWLHEEIVKWETAPTYTDAHPLNSVPDRSLEAVGLEVESAVPGELADITNTLHRSQENPRDVTVEKIFGRLLIYRPQP